MAPDPLDELQVSLQRLGRLLASRQASSRLVESAGVDMSQQGVALTRVLFRQGQLAAADLAAAAGMDLGAVSRQVRLLERDGLVSRSSDPDDGRVVLLELTPAGQRIATRLTEISSRHMAAALDGWSDRQRSDLARSIQRLVDDLAATPMPGSREHEPVV